MTGIRTRSRDATLRRGTRWRKNREQPFKSVKRKEPASKSSTTKRSGGWRPKSSARPARRAWKTTRWRSLACAQGHMRCRHRRMRRHPTDREARWAEGDRLGTLKGRGDNDVHPEHGMRTKIPATLDTPMPMSSLTSHITVRGDTPGFLMQKNQALNVSYAIHSYHSLTALDKPQPASP